LLFCADGSAQLLAMAGISAILSSSETAKSPSNDNDTVLGGLQGSAADGFALLARFEEKLAEIKTLSRCC
jgi:ATP-dependent protease HslVU (ClpYQ) peptidase subunit